MPLEVHAAARSTAAQTRQASWLCAPVGGKIAQSEGRIGQLIELESSNKKSLTFLYHIFIFTIVFQTQGVLVVSQAQRTFSPRVIASRN